MLKRNGGVNEKMEIVKFQRFRVKFSGVRTKFPSNYNVNGIVEKKQFIPERIENIFKISPFY